MRGETPAERAARERYLTLLRSGGNDYPMEQLKKAGVDLEPARHRRAIVESARRPGQPAGDGAGDLAVSLVEGFRSSRSQRATG